jgi:high-affinity nickel-transport protein
MQDMPADWTSLAALVFLLGLKHGFDADHLAIIDGLTRHNARMGRGFARFCGALFSIGHGVIVIAVAVGVAALGRQWQPPGWLEANGAWISIAFLTLIGVVNLRAVLAAAPGEVVSPIGIKGRFLGGLACAGHPGSVALVGALFALSFDTVSQSALFAVAATTYGGVGHAALLGLLFLLGMLVTDAINGLWISRLIARADQVAALASRVMGLAVAAVSLLVAGFGAARLAVPALDAWGEGKEMIFGGIVVAVVALGYLAARALAMRDAPRLAPAAVRADSAAGPR